MMNRDDSQTNTNRPHLTQLQAAQGRSSAYTLFSTMYLRGVTLETLPYVQSLPELAAHIGAFDPDTTAAAHYHLFGLNVFPCAGIFLDDSNLMGGRVSTEAAAFYRSVGFAASHTEQPDHIGAELALLAFLCGAEADALEDVQDIQAARMRDHQQRFLHDHLLPWLLIFTEAVRAQEQPFYTALAGLTLDLVLDHHASLRGDEAPDLPLNLPAPPALLDDDKTSVKDIAAYLLTPAYSGWYLSRDDITRLARAFDLPRGFGDRLTMLTNLLRAAADYEKLDDLLAALQSRAKQWAAVYIAHQTALPCMADWGARTAAVEALLNALRKRAKSFFV